MDQTTKMDQNGGKTCLFVYVCVFDIFQILHHGGACNIATTKLLEITQKPLITITSKQKKQPGFFAT